MALDCAVVLSVGAHLSEFSTVWVVKESFLQIQGMDLAESDSIANVNLFSFNFFFLFF